MTSWISDLSNQVSQSISQIEKTLDTAVQPAEPAANSADVPSTALSWEQRALAAEARAEGLLKEGLVLAEKQGKAEGALRKVRKEKDELEAKDKATSEALAAALEDKARMDSELKELREVKRRGEESIAHITESNAEAARRVEEAKAAQTQAEKREQDLKAQLERAFVEAAEIKKSTVVLTQQLAVARKEAENARFQLKEQLDSKQVQGSRADNIERTLHEVRAALEEQVKEARAVEQELRAELARVTEAKKAAERRADEAASEMVANTTPLLRQIDALQKLRERYDESAAALLTRAVAAEAAEGEATQARRRAEAARADLQARVSEMEAQLLTLRAEVSRASSDAKMAAKRADEAEKERDVLSSTLDAARLSLDAKLAEARAVEFQLRQALAAEQERGEKARALFEERSKDLMARHSVELRRAHPESTPSSQREEATHVMHTPSKQPTQTEILEASLGGSRNEDDLVEGGGVLATHELRTRIRRRDVKITVLEEQLQTAMRGREALANELAAASQRIKALEAAGAASAKAAKELETAQHRNAVLLELLGEREEVIDQLKSDLDLLTREKKS